MDTGESIVPATREETVPTSVTRLISEFPGRPDTEENTCSGLI